MSAVAKWNHGLLDTRHREARFLAVTEHFGHELSTWLRSLPGEWLLIPSASMSQSVRLATMIFTIATSSMSALVLRVEAVTASCGAMCAPGVRTAVKAFRTAPTVVRPGHRGARPAAHAAGR